MLFWSGMLLAVLAVGLGLWAIGGPWADQAYQRGHKSLLPWWWPWLAAMAAWCAPFVTWRMRGSFRLLGSRAGLGGFWQVEHWLAARMLIALIAALISLSYTLLSGMGPVHVILLAVLALVPGFYYPEHVLKRRCAARRQSMMRELPFMLDLMTLCVEAGLSLSAAMQQVASHAPAGPLRQSLRDAAALERTGMERAKWLEQWSANTDVPGVRNLVLTLAQADRLGMNLGPLLRAQSERERSERFARAETLALQAPVKMLFPMVTCIFPCTFLVIAFPIAVKLMDTTL